MCHSTCTEVRGHSWVGYYLSTYFRQHLLFTVSYRRLADPLASEDSPMLSLPFHSRFAGEPVMCTISLFLIHCLEIQNSSPQAWEVLYLLSHLISHIFLFKFLFSIFYVYIPKAFPFPSSPPPYVP